jgi:hypothetical protein
MKWIVVLVIPLLHLVECFYEIRAMAMHLYENGHIVIACAPIAGPLLVAGAIVAVFIRYKRGPTPISMFAGARA